MKFGHNFRPRSDIRIGRTSDSEVRTIRMSECEFGRRRTRGGPETPRRGVSGPPRVRSRPDEQLTRKISARRAPARRSRGCVTRHDMYPGGPGGWKPPLNSNFRKKECPKGSPLRGQGVLGGWNPPSGLIFKKKKMNLPGISKGKAREAVGFCLSNSNKI